MGLSAAERAKRYRDSLKADPVKHAEYLQKEKERYRKRKTKGDFNWTDMSSKSEREKSYMRRQWKNNRRVYRQQQKVIEEGISFMERNSPTTSPETSPLRIRIERPPQNISGRKRVKRDRAKAYRTVGKLEKEVQRYKRLIENYRKKEQRLRKRSNIKSHETVQKKNEFGDVMVKALANKFKQAKGEKEKRIIADVVAKELLMKSRIQKQFTRETGISYYRLVSNALRAGVKGSYERTGRSVVWRTEMRRKVKKYLEEDISSIQAPGKKDTITRNGKKTQKRYLTDTLLNLYNKYMKQYPDDTKLSYTSFCRFRPFWVVTKKVDSRDTCLCKLHENIKRRIEKLHLLKVIYSRNPEEICEQLVCDLKSKACCYGDCLRCRNKELCDVKLTDIQGNQVTFCQWVNRSEEIPTKDGKSMRKIQKTVKQTEQATVDTLFGETIDMLRHKYIRHIFNIRHQYITLKELKDNINNTNAVIHVDFSENYNCKLSEEIQSMHFGGSRKQISLHTVVVYTSDGTQSYCTVSENTYHGPGAIWAHLSPILADMKQTRPQICALHFVSDGPCTQYRSKNHFYMFTKQILENYEYDTATWNFTESGHGKSAADGIGGVVKRTADSIVAAGTDIPNAEVFYDLVGQRVKKVRLLLIAHDDIEQLTESIPANIPTVKGTMKLHQVVINKTKRGVMHLRQLSCFCSWPVCCNCYVGDVSEHIYVSEIKSTTEQSTIEHECPAKTSATTGCKSKTQPGVSNHVESQSTTIHVEPNPDLIGGWCVVSYDGKAYPGIIQVSGGIV